jgi:hypothetical protein
LDFFTVFLDQASDLIQFMTTKIPRFRQFQRLKPKLCITSFFGHMYMDGFASVEAEKEEAIPSETLKDRQHGAFVVIGPVLVKS